MVPTRRYRRSSNRTTAVVVGAALVLTAVVAMWGLRVALPHAASHRSPSSSAHRGRRAAVSALVSDGRLDDDRTEATGERDAHFQRWQAVNATHHADGSGGCGTPAAVADGQVPLSSSSCPTTMDDDAFQQHHRCASVWDPRTVARRSAAALTPVVVQQLLSYDRKAQGKLIREQPPEWFDYLALGDDEVGACRADVAPECSIFAQQHGDDVDSRSTHNTTLAHRLTTIQEAAAAVRQQQHQNETRGERGATVDGHSMKPMRFASPTFLFSKCCHEHAALRRALRCWQRFLSSSSVSTGSRNRNRSSVDAEAARASSPGDHHPSSWWLAFGTLLGAVRAGIEGRSATVIPWDTDVDVMLEPATPLSEALERAMGRGDRIGGCRARLADAATRQHTHGTLLGFIYGGDDSDGNNRRYEEAQQQKLSGNDGTGTEATTAISGLRRRRSGAQSSCDTCSRIELWLRNAAKKSQQAADIFPLRPWHLYDVPAWIPGRAPTVLERGYGADWCFPCKHRTSACKHVQLRG